MNRAIGLIGGERIADPEAGYSGKTRRVVDLFDTIYAEALTVWPWANCRKRWAIPASNKAPEWGFAYQYVLPDNTWTVQAACTGGREFEVEGGYILTDASGPLKVLLTDLVDPERLHPLIAYYVACRLALGAVMAQAESTTLQERVKGFLEMAFVEAVTADNSQGSSLAKLGSEWVLAMQTSYAPELRVSGMVPPQSSWMD